MRSIRNCAVGIVLVIASALTGGCATDQAVISQAEQFHSGLQPAVIKDEVLNTYLNEVGRRIVSEAREMAAAGQAPKSTREAEDNSWMFTDEITFHLVNSKTVNAFTTGGKHMYIYTALFEACKTEDELAAVMAHEYAHIYGRHVHNGMNRQYGSLALAAAAGAAGYALGGDDRETIAVAAAGTAFMGANFLGMGYSRDDEAEADEYGFWIYCYAGWDPAQFAGFFQTMIDMGNDTTPEFLSSHPTLKSRVEIARKRAAEFQQRYGTQYRKPPVATNAQFEALKARIQQVKRTTPSTESLENAQELLQALPRSCLNTDTDFKDRQKAEEDLRQKLKAREEANQPQKPAQPTRRPAQPRTN